MPRPDRSGGRGDGMRGGGGGRRNRPAVELEILRTEWLNERMVRVVLGGEGISSFADKDFTDRYIKIPFPTEDGGTTIRTYTVRHFDLDAGELWVDVVQHGSVGIGGPWAAAAKPGDRISIRGPGGKYKPDLSADWHLLIGDPAAFPAIACAFEALPADTEVHAVLLAHDQDEASYLEPPKNVSVQWILTDSDPSTGFVDVLRTLDLPDSSSVHAFIHGELDQVRDVRVFLAERYDMDSDRLSLSGYWRQGLDEERFQQAKRSSR